jgi:hypothetical protein
MEFLRNDFLTNAVLTNQFLTNEKTPSALHSWVKEGDNWRMILQKTKSQ